MKNKNKKKIKKKNEKKKQEKTQKFYFFSNKTRPKKMFLHLKKTKKNIHFLKSPPPPSLTKLNHIGVSKT